MRFDKRALSFFGFLKDAMDGLDVALYRMGEAGRATVRAKRRLPK
jgi:hypothetical protein